MNLVYKQFRTNISKNKYLTCYDLTFYKGQLYVILYVKASLPLPFIVLSRNYCLNFLYYQDFILV